MKELIEQKKNFISLPWWMADSLKDAKTGEWLQEPYINLKNGLSYDYTTVNQLPFLYKLNHIPDVLLTQLIDYYQDASTTPQTIPWHLFFCPLSQKLFKTPLLAEDGKTYEKEALLDYLKTHNNTLPNSQRRQTRLLTIPCALTQLIRSEEFQDERQWACVNNDEHKEQQDWHFAKEYFNQKPNGAKLRYAAIFDDQTRCLMPRPKHPQAFLNKNHNTIHSYIKIDGEVYQIARGKKPNARLGKGSFGKVKLSKNTTGLAFALKIERENSLSVANEYETLKDLQLTYGKIQRQDNSKTYTLMPYLGRPLVQLLDTNPKLCNKRPKDSKISANSTYLFFNEKKLGCFTADKEGVVSECLLSKDSLGDTYDGIKEQFELNYPEPFDSHFPYKLCENRPDDDEIVDEFVYLYTNNGGLRYAFMDSSGQIKRTIVQEDAFSIKPQDYKIKVCEQEPSKYDLEEGYFYLFKASLGLMYGYVKNSTLSSSYVKSNESFYKQLDIDFNRCLITYTLKNVSLTTALFKVLGVYPEQLDDNKRLEIAIDICLEVACLHEGLSSKSGKAYAHLDIKPENIVIDSSNRVHLIDFGFSEANPHEPRLFKGMASGTDIYLPYHKSIREMPREQFDMLALKRTLILPLSFYSSDKHETIRPHEQTAFSLLTPKILDTFKLAPYLDTSSTKKERKSFTRCQFNARTLAAILITVRLNLTADYQGLIDNKDLGALITTIYSQNKKSTSLKAIIEKVLLEEKQSSLSANLL